MWPRMGSGTPSSVSALTRDVHGVPASAPRPHTTLSLSSELQAGDPQAQRLTTQQAREDAERLEATGAMPIRRFGRSNSAHFAANSLRLGGNSLQFGEQALTSWLCTCTRGCAMCQKSTMLSSYIVSIARQYVANVYFDRKVLSVHSQGLA